MTDLPRPVVIALAAALFAVPAVARDGLGIFGRWGAFADKATPRCYAIAEPESPDEKATTQAFASVGTWPRAGVRGQFHIRLSRPAARQSPVTLTIGRSSFALGGGGNDAWARDARMDAAIVAAMRSNPAMTVRARDAAGQRLAQRYDLEGAASALDAATLACARLR